MSKVSNILTDAPADATGGSNTGIAARPERKVLGWFVLIWTPFCLFAVASMHFWPSPDSARYAAFQWGFDIVYLLMAFGPLGLLLHLRPKYVQVDADGIRWNNGGRNGKGVLRWENVTDFYEGSASMTQKVGGLSRQILVEGHAAPSDAAQDGAPVVVRFGADWKNAKELKAVIAERATNAKTNAWGICGTRRVDSEEGDASRVFTYDSHKLLRDGISQYVLFGIFGVAALGLYGEMVLRHLLRNWNELGPLPALGWFAVGTGLLSLFGFGMILVMHMSTAQAQTRPADERITVTNEGIEWAGNEGHIRARWDEIEGYWIRAGDVKQPTRWVVATKNGTFDFTMALTNHTILVETIQSRAPRTTPGVWQAGQEEEILPHLLRRPITPYLPGATVHHFQLRTHRSMLFALHAPSLCLGADIMLRDLYGLPREYPGGGVLLALLYAVGVVWAWLWYFRARIEWNDNGIVQYTTLGRHRHVPWVDVAHFTEGDPVRQVLPIGLMESKAGEKIRFCMSISDRDKLCARLRAAVASTSPTAR